MLTATINFYVNLRFINQQPLKKIEIVGKKWFLEVQKMKAEIALLPRHAAPRDAMDF